MLATRRDRRSAALGGSESAGPPHPVRLIGRGQELEVLQGLIAGAREGRSGVLMLRGEPGIGKSALLDVVAGLAEGFLVMRTSGVESEMELAYAGLQQLCRPFAGRLSDLPSAQREALGTAIGLNSGRRPDRFLVGLAVLDLMAAVAEDQPVLCLIDDAQWLDRVTVQTIGFVARRLLAEPIVVLIAARDTQEGIDLGGLPEIRLGGLGDTDAAALLDSVLTGPIDPIVRERMLAETFGNPLALLELPRAWTRAELAEGLAESTPAQMAARLEDGFARRLAVLPSVTRRLLTLAAAEPLGDPALIWRAADDMGLGLDAATAAEGAGLIEFGTRVRFRHPLVRAAAYRTAPLPDRLEAHRALAKVTDPILDPDRRAWHRANSTVSQDDDIAAELERSANRARARGGLLAASALLERAALLSTDANLRANRTLAAAQAKRDAGALDAALRLIPTAEAEPPSELRRALVEQLRGQIAFDQRRGADAARLLLSAAQRLEPLDPRRARDTYLEALAAAIWASSPGSQGQMVAVAKAAAMAPMARTSAGAVDLILDALATRLTETYETAAPLLVRALAAAERLNGVPEDVDRALWLASNRAAGVIATEVWDYEAGRRLGKRQVRVAREAGALVQLQTALNFLANNVVLSGDLSAAAALIEEERLVSKMTGVPPIAAQPQPQVGGYNANASLLMAAFQGDEKRTSERVAAITHTVAAHGQGRTVAFTHYAAAVLHNGLGRYERALDHARRVFDWDMLGCHQNLAAPELAEAAARTGDAATLAQTHLWVSGRARATPTDWALGIAARVEALAAEGAAAESHYQESIERLSKTALRVELARGHLLYGEWLRRQGRRGEARGELRCAYDLLAAMGVSAFAERARRELIATGEKVPKRQETTTGSLTAQEVQIARLVQQGLSNPEIGARLFLSPRTIEWHLGHVFGKVGASSRRELRDLDLELDAPAE